MALYADNLMHHSENQIKKQKIKKQSIEMVSLGKSILLICNSVYIEKKKFLKCSRRFIRKKKYLFKPSVEDKNKKEKKLRMVAF